MKTEALNIALLGMSEKSISTFAYFIRKQSQQILNLSTPSTAQLFIADFDTAAGISQWHEHCRINNKFSIILSVENPHKANSIWVKKPVASSALEKAIGQLVDVYNDPQLAAQLAQESVVKESKKEPVIAIETQPAISQLKAKEGKSGYKREFSDDFSPNLTLSKDEIAESCGLQEDLPVEHREFSKLFAFDAEKSLLHSLQQAIALAKEKQMVVYVEGLPVNIAVLPDVERIDIDLNSRNLRHLCAMSLHIMPKFKVVKVNAMEYKTVFSQPIKQMPTYNQALWQISLWSARGRLMQQLNVNQRMRLKRWPNFTRLQITPYALQIAALWSRYDLSPLEVAQTLKIPQRYVFAFISASYAINIVTQQESQRTIKMDWKPKNSIFTIILRSLRIA